MKQILLSFFALIALLCGCTMEDRQANPPPVDKSTEPGAEEVQKTSPSQQ